MLFCLLLIIASLPCTAATALFLEVYWDGGAEVRWGLEGVMGSWAGGGKERAEGKTFSLCTVLVYYTSCNTFVRLFLPALPFPSLPLLPFLLFSSSHPSLFPSSLILSISLCPPLPPLHSPLSSFFNLLFIA